MVIWWFLYIWCSACFDWYSSSPVRLAFYITVNFVVPTSWSSFMLSIFILTALICSSISLRRLSICITFSCSIASTILMWFSLCSLRLVTSWSRYSFNWGAINTYSFNSLWYAVIYSIFSSRDASMGSLFFISSSLWSATEVNFHFLLTVLFLHVFLLLLTFFIVFFELFLCFFKVITILNSFSLL